jgi:hypothetical protein
MESRTRVDQRRRATIVALAMAVLTAGKEARAQSDAERTATAAALFDQAVKAMAAKDYASACPKLEDVAKLEPEALGARFRLAECYEASGRLASAWGAFLKVEAAAAKAGKGTQRAEAHERAERLKPQLAQVVIVVPDEIKRLPALEIRRDGVEVTSAAFGAPLPVDKGKHSLSSTAQGKKRVEMQFTIEEDGQTLTVNVPPPPDAAPDSGPAAAPERPRAHEIALGTLTGTHVHIESDDPSKPLTLIRVERPVAAFYGPAAVPAEVCMSPCDQAVSVGPRQVFFLGGYGIFPSAEFKLSGSGSVRIKASPGSGGRVLGGGVLAIFGGLGTLFGSIGIPVGVALNERDGIYAGVGILVPGVVLTAIGIPLIVTGRTTFTLKSSTVALRF